MTRGLLLAALACAGILASGGAQHASASFSGLYNGALLYWALADGTPKADIYRYDVGVGATDLTNTPTYQELDPAWSPDGQRFVFVREERQEGNTDPLSGYRARLMIADANGANVRAVTDPPWLTVQRSPAWSPDGSQIAFVAQNQDNTTGVQPFYVYVVNADGSNLHQVVNTKEVNRVSDHMVAWSPRGDQILYEQKAADCVSSCPYHIWSVSSTGSGARLLTVGQSGFNIDPDFSPDGQRIAYVRQSLTDGTRTVWIMNADGSNSHGVSGGTQDHAFQVTVPLWSPDGTSVLWSDNYSQSATGYQVLELATGQIRTIPPAGGHFGYAMSWQASSTPPVGTTTFSSTTIATTTSPTTTSPSGCDLGSSADRDEDGVPDSCDEIHGARCATPRLHVTFYVAGALESSSDVTDPRPRTNGCWTFDRPGFAPGIGYTGGGWNKNAEWNEHWTFCYQGAVERTANSPKAPGWWTYEDIVAPPTTRTFPAIGVCAVHAARDAQSDLPVKRGYVFTAYREAKRDRSSDHRYRRCKPSCKFLSAAQQRTVRSAAGVPSSRTDPYAADAEVVFFAELYSPGYGCPAWQLQCASSGIEHPIWTDAIYKVWNSARNPSGQHTLGAGMIDITPGHGASPALVKAKTREICQASMRDGRLGIYAGTAVSGALFEAVVAALNVCTA